MSVSDPYIKDIKVYVGKFIKNQEINGKITDNNEYFIGFANKLTHIFNNGLIVQQNTKYFKRQIDAYAWMNCIIRDRGDIVNFAYTDSVEKVKECKNLRTNEGRFRLLVKYCLVRKCLHVPVEYLIKTGKRHIFYQENSIIGDEILSEILLSVLLQCSKLTFNFQLDNSALLDDTWIVPVVKEFEVVPCKLLGLRIRFVGTRAVIVKILPNTVVDDIDDIKIGDLLDKINGVYINSTRDFATFDNNKSYPVKLTIVKCFKCDQRLRIFHAQILEIIKQAGIEVTEVMKQYKQTNEEASTNTGYGNIVTYLGYVDTGTDGGVKQIEKAIRSFLSTNRIYHKKVEEIVRIDKVGSFEVGDMGVSIKDITTDEVILKHFYLNISSCGSVPYMPNYFAYIAGDDHCNIASKFKCYIFRCDDEDEIKILLQGIGQGFHRTHYAV